MSDLHIPAPCHESWETMRPVTNGRHCASCNHAVVDVTNMAVAEGRRVLAELTATLHREPSRRTCVRAHATPTGRLVPGRRKLLTTALAAMLASTMAGCVGDGPELGKTQEAVPPPQTHEIHPVPPGRIAFVPTPVSALETTMGDVCLPTPTGVVQAPAPVNVERGAVP